MNFFIGRKFLRFGLLGFALITRLNFGQYPNLAEITEMSMSRRLVETYMNGDVDMKVTDLENAFLSCEDVEDGWKLAFAVWLNVYCLQMSQQARLILAPFHLLRMRFFFFFLISLGFGLILQDLRWR